MKKIKSFVVRLIIYIKFLLRLRKAKHFFNFDEYRRNIELDKFRCANPRSDFSFNDVISKEFRK